MLNEKEQWALFAMLFTLFSYVLIHIISKVQKGNSLTNIGHDSKTTTTESGPEFIPSCSPSYLS